MNGKPNLEAAPASRSKDPRVDLFRAFKHARRAIVHDCEKKERTPPRYDAKAALELKTTINTLQILTSSDRFEPRNEFKDATRATVQKELLQISTLATKLSEQFSNLHAPSVDVLANRGLIRGPIISYLDHLATAANEIDLVHVPVNLPGGRPRNTRVKIIVAVAIRQYEKLAATSSVELNPVGLRNLVQEVLRAAGEDASADQAIRSYVEYHAEAHRQVAATVDAFVAVVRAARATP